MTALEKQLMNMLNQEQSAQESEIIELNKERGDIIELLTSISTQQASILVMLETLNKGLQKGEPKSPEKTLEETLKELLKSFQSELNASLQVSLPKALQTALDSSLSEFIAQSNK